jgi:hypothetical protein
MGEVAVHIEARSRESGQPRDRCPSEFIALILVYLAAWAFTGAHFMADTNVYAQAILRHQHGGGDVDYHSVTGNPFWDFGHILWRPFGWICFVLARPATQLIARQNQRAEVLLTLIGINFLASLGCVLLFFKLSRKVVGNEWSALLATIGVLSADAFLDYAHSGNAYVVGLSCLVAGMYFACSESLSKTSFYRSLSAALFFALAVLFWLPYIFVLPAAMAAPILLYGYEKKRQRRVLQIVIACGAFGLGVYAAAIAIVGIHSLVDLKAWILASGHGHIQPGGLRAAARLAFAVPRSFVNMDRDGMWLKRYLVRDPYAPVTTTQLFGLSLWKLVLFYAAAGVVCFELLRSKPGRILLILLVSTILPISVFAVFIFEAGSIERYLPLYPFVFLAFGYVACSRQTMRASKALLVVALTAMVVVNVNAMRSGRLDARKAEAVARIRDLIPLLGPDSLVLAVNEQDNLAEFRQDFPLDPINLGSEWRTYDVLEINTERLSTWREDLAKRILRTWQRNGTVWLPTRFLRTQPKPEWNWVEGDDKRVHWADLPAFFSKFETGPVVGGEDGFLSLQNNSRNKAILERLTAAGNHDPRSALDREQTGRR